MSLDNIEENLSKVQSRRDEACKEFGRNSEEVQILPVTKYQSLDKIGKLYELGERAFAENRVQELTEKSKACKKKGLSGIEWHLIGPLQANKARAAVLAADVIHSIDSVKILKRVDRIAVEESREIDVYLQVNVSGEFSKSGFVPDELEYVLKESESLENVTIVGLMTMTPASANRDECVEIFAKLAQLRKEYAANYEDLSELSMGMSNDFEAAVEAGTTCVRIGSAILGPRDL